MRVVVHGLTKEFTTGQGKTRALGGVEIEVYDRGIGIRDPEKIFEPYFTTKHHGLGLGLAICQTIVSAHRGRLWATNNPGRGATIHIELPVDGRLDARMRSDHDPGHAN